MRIAWTGEAGSLDADGVPGVAHQLRSGLARRGHTIDVFFAVLERDEPDPAGESIPGMNLRPIRTGWNWGHWYARTPLLRFLSISVVRGIQTPRIARAVMRAHRRAPYDVIFQMSQIEHAFPRERSRRPALVIHPCTLAGLEARWHLRERRLALQAEPIARFAIFQAVLSARSWLQPRCARAADLIVAPSIRFGRLASETLGLDPGRVVTLRHPVDVARFRPGAERRPPPWRALFIGTLSTRKGLELIVDLSRRLDDLAGELTITVVGAPRWWSDYSHLLAGANERLVSQAGYVSPDEIVTLLQDADLLIVPSRFEPGSIVTGEALACGVPVVASNAVGPSEILDDGCGRIFADGDAAALEAATRELLASLASDGGALRAASRTRAVEQLSTDVVADQLDAILRAAVGAADRGVTA
jgi:glycosyltransferase involved in cell wall biosynthesis